MVFVRKHLRRQPIPQEAQVYVITPQPEPPRKPSTFEQIRRHLKAIRRRRRRPPTAFELLARDAEDIANDLEGMISAPR